MRNYPELPLLSQAPAATVAGAVAVMRGIDAVLPEHDGLKWFNYLYMSVTQAVMDRIEGESGWNDLAWITQLDVTFANLYFGALAAQQRAPRSWRALLDARGQTRTARLQFALAGMNAHINRDLAVALVDTCRVTGGEFLSNEARRADYQRVNGILEAVEDSVKGEFLTGPLAQLDYAAGRLDDVLAMWSVRAARDAAWVNGGVLWTLSGLPWIKTAWLDKLDGTVGLAGRGLLRRVI